MVAHFLADLGEARHIKPGRLSKLIAANFGIPIILPKYAYNIKVDVKLYTLLLRNAANSITTLRYSAG